MILCHLLFSCSVVSDSETPWTAAHQASLSFTISQSLFKLMSTESVMPFNHLILCGPFSSYLQSFPASGSFPMSIQGWFPLELTVWSPFSPRDSQESSPAPQFKTINSLVLSLLYGPTLTSIHDYWKTIALTMWTFVGKVISLLFTLLSRFVMFFLPRSIS